MPLKLELLIRHRMPHTLLQVNRNHFLRIRIQRPLEILPARIRVRVGEQAVVQTHFRFQHTRGADPVDGALDLVVVRAVGAALGIGEVIVAHGDACYYPFIGSASGHSLGNR